MNALTSDLEYLADLASHNELADRGKLLLSLGSLLIDPDHPLDPKKQELCVSSLMSLLSGSSLDDKIGLAECLATAPRAPLQLIKALAESHIAAAMIVLEQSPVLGEHDLIDITQTKGTDHCKSMAVRNDLSETICSAIISNGDEETLKTLINNHVAMISPNDMARLVAIAKRFPVLALPLLQRPNVSRRHAEEIADASSLAVKALVARMVPTYAVGGPRAHQSKRTENSTDSAQLKQAQQKVKALKESGRLRTAVLVKALHQKDEKLFIAAFAEFLELTTSFLAKLLKAKSASAMALAYRALGGSQQQFETIIVLYRSMKNRPTNLSDTDRAQIDRIFRAVSQEGAKSALASLV